MRRLIGCWESTETESRSSKITVKDLSRKHVKVGESIPRLFITNCENPTNTWRGCLAGVCVDERGGF
ncbi:MAG: hypothetical protein QW096_05160 [Thermofilaceae archaeon]